MKRLYRRYFVLLDTESENYNLSANDKAKGYAKIEVKNDRASIGLHCQNLKKLDNKNERYRIYLLKTNGEKKPVKVDLGPMEVDSSGKAEGAYEFYPENVRGTKIPIEDFDVIIVLIERSDENNSIVAPLVGYVHKDKVDWRKAFSSKNNQEKNNAIIKKDLNIDKKVSDQNRKLDVGSKVSDKKNESSNLNNKEKESNITIPLKLEDKKTTKKEAHKNEIVKEKPQVEDKEFKQIPSEEFKVLREEKVKPLEREQKAQNDPTENHIQHYIESTLKLYPCVNPFEKNFEGYEWWQIFNNQQTIYRAYMPFIAYLEIMNNPYQYQSPYFYPSDYYRLIYLYQHYLFGICYSEERSAKYFVYAIPGRCIKAEQPYGGTTGFVYWHPCIEGEEGKNGLGYWLAHIDPKTGLVVYPFEATSI
ncbi:hypothetical protein RH915_06835 [Serpentinicella sp. ANB-PHB4]|uniref:hypothetical protein n=1 Tax=Serpentinicella sp. ANB-PHB4 TaxID=3074076 RepID=UPI00285598FA|nr:hypothetical protein [Serpentinicella sp. ANB-PHB4]MDR5659201.1 hypothetical protein [Serpentinicella sp. ANB-PHB4]